MKIGILSRNRSLYSTQRLVNAAQENGHVVSVIDTMSVVVEVGVKYRKDTSGKVVTPIASSVRTGRGIPINSISHLPQVDAIIPRIGTSITQYGLAVVRQFETIGVLTTANSRAIAQSRDKLHSLQVMSQAGLPTPRTAVVNHPSALYSAIHAVGGAPVVIKLIHGTQGRGVLLVPNLATAAVVLDKLRGAKRQALVQEFIEEARGKDLRIIVVGNRCVAAMTRIANDGEFRANLHLGGSAVPMTLDEQTKQLALDAARAHGLSVAGVDIIQSNRGPLLLEVNSSPGLEGIENVTKIDVASEIIQFLERAIKKHKRLRYSKRDRSRK